MQLGLTKTNKGVRERGAFMVQVKDEFLKSLPDWDQKETLYLWEAACLWCEKLPPPDFDPTEPKDLTQLTFTITNPRIDALKQNHEERKEKELGDLLKRNMASSGIAFYIERIRENDYQRDHDFIMKDAATQAIPIWEEQKKSIAQRKLPPDVEGTMEKMVKAVASPRKNKKERPRKFQNCDVISCRPIRIVFLEKIFSFG